MLIVTLLCLLLAQFCAVSAFRPRLLTTSFAPKVVPARSQPLSTVSTIVLGHIPRLEIGLRFVKTTLPTIHYDDIKFINPLNNWINARPFRKSGFNLSFVSKLFSRASGAVNGLAYRFMQHVRKIVAVSLVTVSGFMNPAFRKISAAAALAVTAMPKAAHAGAVVPYSKLSPTQKLATTPLFFVCNSQGSPYLQEDVQAGKPEQRVVVYFMSSEDANEYLNEIAQGNPQNLNEFRVMATSMEKIVNKIQSRKQSRKMGRYPVTLVYRIQPSQRQCENAERIAGDGDKVKGAQALYGLSIPMFTVKDMLIQRKSGEMVSPYYFAYEDMMEDWKEMAKTSLRSEQVATVKPAVVVKDFVEVMCLAKNINSGTLFSQAGANSAVGFTGAASHAPAVVPPKREIEMLRRFYRNEAGMKGEFQQAKLMGASR